MEISMIPREKEEQGFASPVPAPVCGQVCDQEPGYIAVWVRGGHILAIASYLAATFQGMPETRLLFCILGSRVLH